MAFALPGSSRPAVLAHADENLVLGNVDGTLVVIWRGFLTLDAIAREFEFFRAELAKMSRPPFVLSIIEEGSTPPNQPMRKYMAEQVDLIIDDVAGVGFVLLGPAIRVALIRSVQTGMNILARNQRTLDKQKMFSRIDAAVAWASTLVPTPAERLLAGIEQLRAAEESTGVRARPTPLDR